MCKQNEKLDILMKNQNMTQKELAELLFVSPDAVSSWVRGINNPNLETIKQFCKIFYISIQDLTNDDLDIPLYYEVGCYYVNPSDSDHTIIQAFLNNEGMLHRFKNAAEADCSAIYRAGQEVWWHYRKYEAQMISDWNKAYPDD